MGDSLRGHEVTRRREDMAPDLTIPGSCHQHTVTSVGHELGLSKAE